jgi:hypothetical protein
VLAVRWPGRGAAHSISHRADLQDDSGSQIASVCAFRKQPDQALSGLQHALQIDDSGVREFLTDPCSSAYKNDSRYFRLARSIGVMTAAGAAPATAGKP